MGIGIEMAGAFLLLFSLSDEYAEEDVDESVKVDPDGKLSEFLVGELGTEGAEGR